MDQEFIETVLANLPKGVEFASSKREDDSTSIEELLSRISAGERGLLGQNASDKRIREFCLGRLAAKSALAKVYGDKQIKNFEILRRSFRAPLWPVGSVGSISHCSGSAVAIAANSEAYQSLGLDLITKFRKVNPKILDVLCASDEQERLVNGWEGDLNLLKLIVFSAKESLYKLFSSLNLSQMEWSDFDLHLPETEFDQSNFKFESVLSQGIVQKIDDAGITNSPSALIKVQVLVSEQFILSFCELPVT